MKLEDHIQLSHSGVDHYQIESQHAETITLDASLSAAWPCKANVKPTSRHTFHTLLSGNAALATGQHWLAVGLPLNRSSANAVVVTGPPSLSTACLAHSLPCRPRCARAPLPPAT